jgi:hypothetical protein
MLYESYPIEAQRSRALAKSFAVIECSGGVVGNVMMTGLDVLGPGLEVEDVGAVISGTLVGADVGVVDTAEDVVTSATVVVDELVGTASEVVDSGSVDVVVVESAADVVVTSSVVAASSSPSFSPAPSSAPAPGPSPSVSPSTPTKPLLR